MKLPETNGRAFLIQRLEALDQDRVHLHEDIRAAGHDPHDLEAEVLKRKEPMEYDL